MLSIGARQGKLLPCRLVGSRTEDSANSDFAILLLGGLVPMKPTANRGRRGHRGPQAPTSRLLRIESLEPRSLLAVSIVPNMETAAGSGADDPAIWIHPTDTSRSTIIGTVKTSTNAIRVYDLAGHQIQSVASGMVNNVDLRYNFRLGGQNVAIVAGSNRSNNSIVLYQVNPDSGLLSNVAARTISTGMTIYGCTMYVSPLSGKHYVFATSNSGQIQQWELYDNGSAKVDARLVRSFSVGSMVEGCVTDDVTGLLYLSEEDVGIWKYSAEPDGGTTRTLVDKTGSGGHLTADIEGLSIYYTSAGTGYLLASSQGNSTFVIYQRENQNAYVGTFNLVSGNCIDTVSNTDGIDVVNFSLGPQFPKGLFVAQDNDENFKAVRWDSVSAAFGGALSIDTTWDPRSVGAAPQVNLANTTSSLPENTPTNSRVKVADIVLTNDRLHTGVLSLSGPDASLFEIVDSILYIKAGTVLDSQANPQLDVTVVVDGPNTPANPDDTAALSIVVTAPNLAPALDTAPDFALDSLDEDPVSNSGVLVSSLVGSAISDPDGPDVPQGIAVLAANHAFGQWQYSLDGSTWSSFGAPSASQARLLATDSDNRIRFVPNADSSGTIPDGLTFRAWDQASGADGALATISATGGTSPFSSQLDTISITVNPVNDAPQLTVPPAQTVLKDSNSSLAGIRIGDVDAGDANLTLLLSVAHGTLTVRSDVAGGLTAADLQGNATASVTLTGSLARINATLAAAGGLIYRGDLAYTGPDAITATVNDQGNSGYAGALGDTKTISLSVVLNQANTAYLAADPLDTSKTALYVFGTDAADKISVKAGSIAGDVSITINSVAKGTFHPTSRIIVHGLAGSDTLQVSSSVTLPAWLYGDDGNDALSGGGGAHLLLGGNGTDTLKSGSGRSILIGGSGGDTLRASSAGAIFIGGTTDYDANDQALLALLSEWNSSASYATRTSHVTGTAGGINGSYFFNASTLYDDAVRDTIYGGSASDLFFRSATDTLYYRRSSETLLSVTRR